MLLECIIARIHNSEVEELNIQSPSFVIINSGMLVDTACPGHWANASRKFGSNYWRRHYWHRIFGYNNSVDVGGYCFAVHFGRLVKGILASHTVSQPTHTRDFEADITQKGR